MGALVHAPRHEWRDAIKSDQRLSAHAVLVGLLVADYWKTGATEPLWAVNDRLIQQSRLSRAAVYRALRELRDLGFLHEVEPARHGRSPRWIARCPLPQLSPTETDRSLAETDRSPGETRDLTHTSSSWEGASDDVDRRVAAPPPLSGREGGPFPAQPRDAKERADFILFAAHMTNYKGDSAADVYAWMRAGSTEQTPIKWPGAFARRKHALRTSEEHCSEWQGYFRRRFLADSARPVLPAVRPADPWAA